MLFSKPFCLADPLHLQSIVLPWCRVSVKQKLTLFASVQRLDDDLILEILTIEIIRPYYCIYKWWFKSATSPYTSGLSVMAFGKVLTGVAKWLVARKRVLATTLTCLELPSAMDVVVWHANNNKMLETKTTTWSP